jgi:hypothetical protein
VSWPGIVSWEPVSVVAVKMVKPHADITYLKESEEAKGVTSAIAAGLYEHD